MTLPSTIPRLSFARFRWWLSQIVTVALLVGLLVCPAVAQRAGEPIGAFTAGGLDIHHINTGEGSSAFAVLPDGTTLLIDCGYGQAARAPKYKAPRRPDELRLPGEWIARYIKRVHPGGGDAAVDYAVVSHFHGDHMGGFEDLLRTVRVRSFFDRGAPDYGGPLPFNGALAGLYKSALKEQVDRHGMKVARIKAGAADQIVLRHAADKYPDFEVRNLAVNGEAWTGYGNEVRARVSPNEKHDENTYSAAMRLRYGRFKYYTGGDLPGSPTETGPLARDMESAIAWATGPVDVAVLNHHGNSDGSNPFFLSVLQPRVCVVNVWAARQIDPETYARLRSEKIYSGPRDIFATNGMWDGRADHIKQVFGETVGLRHLEDLKSLASDQGHVVVRVAPGGNSYHVIVLDDRDEKMTIRSVHGPYSCR